jgi:hypothetical protein
MLLKSPSALWFLTGRRVLSARFYQNSGASIHERRLLPVCQFAVPEDRLTRLLLESGVCGPMGKTPPNRDWRAKL